MDALKTVVSLVGLSLSCSLFAQTETSSRETHQITDRGPHHRVWSATSWETNQLGQVLARTNSYVELANGLHYTNSASGQLEESNPGFEITDDGFAVARHCQHQVVITPNLNPEDGVVVDLLTPDGQRLRSGVIGLSLFDPKSGSSLQVGMVWDVVGTLVSSNEIVWFDAFEGLRADVRVRNERGEFHQDVLLRERLTSDQLRALGFDAASVQLEIWTEFIEPPQPGVMTTVVRSETDALVRSRMVQPDRIDQRLDFGTMRMELNGGKAFTDRESGDSAPVLKEWRDIGGRRFLIESSSWEELTPLLESLPPKTASLDLQSHSARIAANRTAPIRAEPGLRAGAQSIKLAKADTVPSAGVAVVLDYELINQGLPGYTFQGDTTYYVSAPVTSSGLTRFEGGAVLKYAANASLTLSSSATLDWQAGPYRPAILTAKDDNTVGQTISGSSGNPGSGAYANPALRFYVGGGVSHFRIAYAQQAIAYSYTGLTFANGQFVKCANGVSVGSGSACLRNVLFASVDVAFNQLAYTDVTAEHVTFGGGANYPATPAFLALPSGSYPYNLRLTNCILSKLTAFALGSGAVLTGDHNGFWNNGVAAFGSSPINCPVAQNPFQTVGAGHYYLNETSPSFRNVGTGLINPDLAVALKSRTTFAPTEITANIAADRTLSPRNITDTDLPDLGYHYDALDWAVNYISVSPGVTVALESGVAIGFYGGLAGFQLGNGASLESNGEGVHRVSLTRYTTVQEQPVWWARVGSQTGGAYLWGQPTAACQVTLNGTDIYLAGAKLPQDYLASVTGSGSVSLSHCQVFGGRLTLTPYHEMQLGVQWFNNLFWRTSISVEDAQSPWRAVNLTAHNNLFYRGYLGLQHNYYSQWITRDNAFDGVGLTVGGNAWPYGGGNSHNGYINTAVLPGSYGGDVSLTSFTYQNGPRGSFYHQSTGFRDLGSRSAVVAGLNDYTTQSDQTADTGTVDIGFHCPMIAAPTTCTDDQGLCVNGTLPLCGSDPQGLPLTFITVQAPAHGTLGYDQSGNFVYTPNNCYSGADTFTYKVNNGYSDSSADTVTVTISTTVTANPDDSKQTCKNTALSFNVTGWDSCSLALTYALVSGPTHSQTFSLSSSGSVNYSPLNGYCGIDSFQFRAINQCGQVSAPATVTIKVGYPNPVANCQEVMTGKNTPITIELSGQTDEACGEALTFEILVPGSGPLNGTLGPIVSVDATHATVVYTPNTDYEGFDSFEFTVRECGIVSPPSGVPINVVSAPILVTSCRPDRILLHWSPPQLPDGFIKDFLIYRCDTAGGDCEPTAVYHTVTDPNARFFEDTGVQAGKTYCYRVSFRHQTACVPPSVYESPLSNKDCNQICTPPAVLVSGNNAAFGFGPIQTYDYLTGNLLNSFIPDGAKNSEANGRGIAVRGTELFYTEVGPSGSDGIHIAPYGTQGSGGSDLRTPLNNPRPGAGIQDLVFYNGTLYILTGYPRQAPEVFKLDATTGAVIAGPIPIESPARENSDGFTVLPNGNFLINDGDGEPVYHEYDNVTGQFVSSGLEIDLRVYGFSDGTGVQLAADRQSLFFITDIFRSNQTIVQTDLTGGLMGFQPIGPATIEDIELVIP